MRQIALLIPKCSVGLKPDVQVRVNYFRKSRCFNQNTISLVIFKGIYLRECADTESIINSVT